MAKTWSESDNEAIVRDYFVMLELEQVGQPFNKAEHRRALIEITGRSHGSIEFKHCNISAVMEILGLPSIDGYRPRGNFQEALFEVVKAHLEERPDFYNLLSGQSETLHDGAAEYSAGEAIIVDEAPPQRGGQEQGISEDIERIVRRFENPAERDARGTGILGRRVNRSFTNMKGTVSNHWAARICPKVSAGSQGMTAMAMDSTFFPSAGRGITRHKSCGWR